MTIVPAVLLVAWGLFAAAGMSLQAPAHAATSNVTVTATVLPEIHIGGACAASTIALSTSIDPIGTLAETPDCVISFGSTNSTAGVPSFLQIQNSVAGAFFCYDADGAGAGAHTCVANKTFTDHAGTNTALANGEFGARYNAAPTGCTSPTWTNGATNFNGIPANGSPATLCNQTSTATDGVVTTRFGAKGNGTMAPSTNPAYYTGIAQFIATAN